MYDWFILLKGERVKKFLYIISSILAILGIFLITTSGRTHIMDFYTSVGFLSAAVPFFLTAAIIGAIEKGVVTNNDKEDLSKDYESIRAKEKEEQQHSIK